MQRTRSISLLVAAESVALVFALLAFLADKLVGLGPDGTLTTVLLVSFLAIAVLLLVAIPPLVWFGTRSLLAAKDNRTSLGVGSIVIGICIWLLVASWLVFVYQANGK